MSILEGLLDDVGDTIVQVTADLAGVWPWGLDPGVVELAVRTADRRGPARGARAGAERQLEGAFIAGQPGLQWGAYGRRLGPANIVLDLLLEFDRVADDLIRAPGEDDPRLVPG